MLQKDLLGTRDLPAETIREILKTAAGMKTLLLSDHKKAPDLQGKSVVMLFYENSTRTRVSFELACKYLSASTANISASASSVAKGETLYDTGRTLDMMGTDVIVLRHPCSGSAALLARSVKASVINAGDGMNEHPTQALLDLYTVWEKKGTLQGLKIAILGDIYHSRVARSDLWAFQKMGADVVLCAPPTMMPLEMEKTGARIAKTAEEAVAGADVIMGLRIQRERQQAGLLPSLREYSRYYAITEERLAMAAPGALVMHPGPINRGIELDGSVADGAQSVIEQQVRNGVAVRMALLSLMIQTQKGGSL